MLGLPVALPINMRADVIELSKLRTLPGERGKGYATELLLDVCIEADMARKFLFLCVEPDDDCPLTTKQLSEMYLRFGFVPIQSDPAVLMTRPYVGALQGAI
jgi:hypothetical protein